MKKDTNGAFIELPTEGSEPQPLEPRKQRPAARRIAPPAPAEPRITASQFSSRLATAHRGGFLAFCKLQGLDIARKTVSQWQELLSGHWARPIK